jgi:Ca2+-dependent lipid-binding protein
MWRIQRVEFKISGKKPNGNNWDLAMLGDGKAPDPFFTMAVGNSRPLKTISRSETFNNVYEGVWYPNSIVQLKPGEIIVISAEDRDTGSNHDYIGAVAFSTDEIFKYEPSQPILAMINDDNGGFASAIIYFER